MEWFPIVAATFKVIVLAIGMFFAIKWHYDQGAKKNGKEMTKVAVLLAGGKIAAIFLFSLSCLALLTFFLMRKFGLETMMTFS